MKQMVVTLLEIKGEVAKLMIFELFTQIFNFFNMLFKDFVQVILNREGLHLLLLLFDLLLLEHYFVGHISDHNDQLSLPVDINLMLLQNNRTISSVTLRQPDIVHFRFIFKSQQSLNQCEHALAQIYITYRLAGICHFHLPCSLFRACSF